MEAQFPDDIALSIDCFNDVKDKKGVVVGKKLCTNFQLVDVAFAEDKDGNPTCQQVPFMHWKFLVEGSDQAKDLTEQDGNEDMLADAVQRLGSLTVAPDSASLMKFQSS